MDRMTGVHGTLMDYALHAITRGKDAVAEASVSVNFGDEVVPGKGSSTNVVEASAKAYLNALNRYLMNKSVAARKAPGRTDRKRKA